MACVSARKRSWHEILTAVKTNRNVNTGQSSRTPNNFTFSDQKLYFLALPEARSEYTLFYVDLPSNKDTESGDHDDIPTAQCHLLVDLDSLRPFQGFSREEQLLRERKRLGSFGITSYEYDKNSRSLLFPACSSLYICKDHVIPNSPGDYDVHLVPGEVASESKESRMDPKLSPTNPNLIAFILHHDLWVSNVSTQTEQRLTWSNTIRPLSTTTCSSGSCHNGDDGITCGVPSYIAQEEFDRYTGYWWKPMVVNEDQNGDQNDDDGGTQKYCILYEQVDQSDVEIHTMTPSLWSNAPPSCDTFRYPRAGTQNSTSCLKLVEFALDKNGAFTNDIVTYEMKVSLQELFPWMEYVVRCGWMPLATGVWIQMVDRQQQRIVVAMVPLMLFVPVTKEDSMECCHESPSQAIQVLLDESSDIWINVCDIIYFMKSNTDKIQFIWSSETSGFRHLYLIECEHDGSEMSTDCLVIKPPTQSYQLTYGDWPVYGNKIWVDESKQMVYFMAGKQTPIEQHLYAVSYDGLLNSNAGQTSRQIYLLTQPGFSHSITLNEDCSMFISVYSSIKDVPAVTLYKIVHNCDNNKEVSSEPVFHIRPPGEVNSQSISPDLVKLQSKHGHDVYGMIFKPPFFQHGIKYPTVLFVYGGPAVQMVINSHKGVRYSRLQTLAMMGYLVISFDCRGSFHRGQHFEKPLKNNLGGIEIEDQVEALLQLANTTDFIDLKRIAIHGWSYGGYLSLLGLIKNPEIFKLAIAGAPVTDWESYDTAYTERYMNTPQANPIAYGQSSLLNNAHLLPNEPNRLLIIHGLMDENVHFHHTSLLIQHLIAAGKPYQLQVYPSERHGIRQAKASEHYETTVLMFLENYL